MIFEVFMMVGSALPFAALAYSNHKDVKQLERLQQAPTVVNTPAAVSDEVEIILELLKRDDGWKKLSDNIIEHVTGVKLKREVVRQYDYYNSSYETFYVSIKNAEGNYNGLSTTPAESKLLIQEFKSFFAREKTNRATALKREFAKRVLQFDSGEILPVLGGSGDNGSTPSTSGDDEPTSSSLAARAALTYDKVSKQIVASERGSDVQLVMSDELKARYDVLIQKAAMEAYTRGPYTSYEEAMKLITKPTPPATRKVKH